MIRCDRVPTLRSEHELPLFDRQHFAANDARGLHPAGDADDGHDQDENADLRPQDGAQRIAEQHDADQQQWQNRQRQEEIGQPHQRAVEPLEETGQDADAGSEGQRQRHGGDAHRKRKPPASQHPGEHVAAQVVGAQRVGERHALVLGLVVDVLRINTVDDGPEQHRQGNQGEDRRAAQRALMAPELLPDISRQRAVLCSKGRCGVSQRILGSSTPYSRSATRLNRCKNG